MSDNWIVYISNEPDWQPSREAADAAAQILRRMAPDADEIEVEFNSDIQFIDCGSNFETVRCPACDTDLTDWWSEAMEQAYANRFEDLSVHTPCCATATSLNDLRYDWPVGFAKFSLSARNAGIGTPSPEQDAEMANALGLAVVRRIHRHI